MERNLFIQLPGHFILNEHPEKEVLQEHREAVLDLLENAIAEGDVASERSYLLRTREFEDLQIAMIREMEDSILHRREKGDLTAGPMKPFMNLIYEAQEAIENYTESEEMRDKLMDTIVPIRLWIAGYSLRRAQQWRAEHRETLLQDTAQPPPSSVDRVM